MYDYRTWEHVFKLDPNNEIDDQTLELICESDTDAIMIGGSDGVTLDNVINLMSRVRRYSVPCVLEVSSFDAITPGFDLYFIPTVLNSNNHEWIIGQHHRAVKEFGHWINWNEMVVEGYCVLNENSKVAQLTSAITNLDEEDVTAYATISEEMLHLPIFYIEYSGTYGDVEIVKAAKEVLKNTVLFYGGGIDSKERAIEMKKHADVIVVGNLIYQNIEEALKTVEAVKKGVL